MARIDYPSFSALSPMVRQHFETQSPLNVTHMLSHNEGVMAGVARLGAQLLSRGTLAPELREIVIVRVGRLCNSEYEAHQHEKIASELGVSDEKLKALRGTERSMFDATEQAALRYIEQLHSDGGVNEEVFFECARYFSPSQLVELCILGGFYTMIAGFLTSFDVKIEATSRTSRPGSIGSILD